MTIHCKALAGSVLYECHSCYGWFLIGIGYIFIDIPWNRETYLYWMLMYLQSMILVPKMVRPMRAHGVVMCPQVSLWMDQGSMPRGSHVSGIYRHQRERWVNMKQMLLHANIGYHTWIIAYLSTSTICRVTSHVTAAVSTMLRCVWVVVPVFVRSSSWGAYWLHCTAILVIKYFPVNNIM